MQSTNMLYLLVHSFSNHNLITFLRATLQLQNTISKQLQYQKKKTKKKEKLKRKIRINLKNVSFGKMCRIWRSHKQISPVSLVGVKSSWDECELPRGTAVSILDRSFSGLLFSVHSALFPTLLIAKQHAEWTPATSNPSKARNSAVWHMNYTLFIYYDSICSF